MNEIINYSLGIEFIKGKGTKNNPFELTNIGKRFIKDFEDGSIEKIIYPFEKEQVTHLYEFLKSGYCENCAIEKHSKQCKKKR